MKEWYKNEQNNRRFLAGCLLLLFAGILTSLLLIIFLSWLQQG